MFKTKIKKGIRLLTDDQLRLVDLSTLDMGYTLQCVLGGLYGNYIMGLDALGIVGDDRHDKARELGFNIPCAARRMYDSSQLLTQEWVAAIKERLSKKEVNV